MAAKSPTRRDHTAFAGGPTSRSLCMSSPQEPTQYLAGRLEAKGLLEAWRVDGRQEALVELAEDIAGHEAHASAELWMAALHLVVEPDPVELGHPEVHEHRVDVMSSELIERVEAILRQDDRVLLLLQADGQQIAELDFVVNDEDGRAGTRHR